jgi:23S rRNA (uracil1939-C5)-methyltransferase
MSDTAASTSETEQQPTKRSAKPARGEVLRLRTHSFAFEGKAVARREDGYVIFVEGALANEEVEVEVFKAKGSFAESRLLKIISPSESRRTPLCPYFGICGGCSLQHMTYSEQLRSKTQQVRELFHRIGNMPDVMVLDAIGSAEEYHYRNKMEFSFSDERWLMPEEIGSDSPADRYALGLHVRNRYDRVLDTKACFLPKRVVVDIMDFSRRFVKENQLGVFHPDRNPDGLARFLMIRTSEHTGEIMVNIITSRRDDDAMQKYSRELLQTVPEITTIVNNINGRRAQVATGDREYVLHGSGTITDKIGQNSFQISPNSFFQTNTRQAERLYEIAREFANLKPTDTMWDLYCGTGTISLFCAPQVKQVLGVELVEAAIADAHKNAERNRVNNVDFVASDLRNAITSPEFLSANPAPDVMIIDPPRSGMHPDVVQQILKLAPERISYISCNPATQARDIAMMSERYRVERVQPVDMFPQTFHIESVAALRRRD